MNHLFIITLTVNNGDKLTWTEEGPELAQCRVTACMCQFPTSMWHKREAMEHGVDGAKPVTYYTGRVY